MTLPVEGEQRAVLREVSLAIAAGEAVGLVGESGSGKSMTARAVARILPPGALVSGSVTFDGRDVRTLRGGALRQYRGEVAVVFQDPRAHTNPVRTIGDFMTEALRTVRGVRGAEARRRAAQVLDEVGIEDGERRLRQYPHELSGGMLQRVMIGAALLTEPRLLLADEPTTALDVTTQAEVMAILDELRRDRGLALLFITHDLELASAVCDRTTVMYAGEIVETQPAARLHDDPLAPLQRRAGGRPAAHRRHRRAAGRDSRPAAVGLRGARRLLVRRPAACTSQDRCRADAPAAAADAGRCRALHPRRGDPRDPGGRPCLRPV